MFNRIVATAAGAGIVAGLLLTGVQHLQVTPLIRTAETYEAAAQAAPAAAQAHEHADEHEHAHEHEHAGAQEHEQAAASAHEHGGEEHRHGGWEPAPGGERLFYTILANISMAVGYALLLAAALTLRGKPVDWRGGLLWGGAAYLVFFVAPALGLPPELPGTEAAPVVARQSWWIATAGATAAALALLAWGRHWGLKVAALALVVTPHLVGAPQPAVHGAVAPAALAREFIVASAVANAAFWLALGALTGWLHARLDRTN
ncbi:CbtA family protein [[Empedobacter] haloabium]|uniref:CbtA family protein n=1 Tax=[Empedobacter] haloabium TaxID=592317 RepID=A0ABZ1UU54_9BURK